MPEYIDYGSPDGAVLGRTATERIGFYGATPVAKQTISGSLSSGVGTSSIAVALAALGLVVNSTAP